MRILALPAALLVALPAAAQAQLPPEHPAERPPEHPPEHPAAPADGAVHAGEPPLSQQLRDPAMQESLAATVAVLGEVLLDLPLAPIVEPMAEAAGRDPASVDPDLTLRKMRPEAGEIPARAAQELPRALDRAAAMAGTVETVRPILADMAGRLMEALEEARRGGR
jgi:hypothetical protein